MKQCNFLTTCQLLCNRGTALILTIFLITTVSGITLLLGRLMVSEIKQTTRLEDSTLAYYTAESGIEQGLLMWRYNNDVEVSTLPVGQAVSEQGSDPIRTDLTTQQTGTRSSIPLTSSHQIYDLKIYHHNDAGVPETGTLEKDQAVEYDTKGVTQGAGVSIQWSFTQTPTPYTPEEINKYNLEFVPFDASREIIVNQLENNTSKKLYDYSYINQSVSFPLTETSRFRLRAWGGSLTYTVTQVNSTEKTDSRYAIIESTGYYGNAKQKLQIKIDRVSGAILDTYDLVILGGQGLTTP